MSRQRRLRTTDCRAEGAPLSASASDHAALSIPYAGLRGVGLRALRSEHATNGTSAPSNR